MLHGWLPTIDTYVDCINNNIDYIFRSFEIMGPLAVELKIASKGSRFTDKKMHNSRFYNSQVEHSFK